MYAYCANSPLAHDDPDGFEMEGVDEQIEDFVDRVGNRGVGSIRYMFPQSGEWAYYKEEYVVTNTEVDEHAQRVMSTLFSGGIGALTTWAIHSSPVGAGASALVAGVGYAAEYEYARSYPTIPEGEYTYEAVSCKQTDIMLIFKREYTVTIHYVWGEDATGCEFFSIWKTTELSGPMLYEYDSVVLLQRAN